MLKQKKRTTFLLRFVPSYERCENINTFAGCVWQWWFVPHGHRDDYHLNIIHVATHLTDTQTEFDCHDSGVGVLIAAAAAATAVQGSQSLIIKLNQNDITVSGGG